MTAVYLAAAAVGFLAVAAVHTVIGSMLAEHRNRGLPTQHHLGRVVWVSATFCVVAVAVLLWLPTVAT